MVIYAGATILGRITVGRGSTIGGNVWPDPERAAGQRDHPGAQPPRRRDLTSGIRNKSPAAKQISPPRQQYRLLARWAPVLAFLRSRLRQPLEDAMSTAAVSKTRHLPESPKIGSDWTTLSNGRSYHFVTAGPDVRAGPAVPPRLHRFWRSGELLIPYLREHFSVLRARPARPWRDGTTISTASRSTTSRRTPRISSGA